MFIKTAFAQALRDPTAPLSVAVAQTAKQDKNLESGVLLTSIFKKDTGNVALISGKVVEVGSNVNGYKVTQISEKSVELLRGTEKLKLELYGYEIKR